MRVVALQLLVPATRWAATDVMGLGIRAHTVTVLVEYWCESQGVPPIPTVIPHQTCGRRSQGHVKLHGQ